MTSTLPPFEGHCWQLSSTELTPVLYRDLIDCSASAEAVDYVMCIHAPTGNVNDCKAYLQPLGMDTDDHTTNLETLIWLAGSDLRESGEASFERTPEC